MLARILPCVGNRALDGVSCLEVDVHYHSSQLHFELLAKSTQRAWQTSSNLRRPYLSLHSQRCVQHRHTNSTWLVRRISCWLCLSCSIAHKNKRLAATQASPLCGSTRHSLETVQDSSGTDDTEIRRYRALLVHTYLTEHSTRLPTPSRHTCNKSVTGINLRTTAVCHCVCLVFCSAVSKRTEKIDERKNYTRCALRYCTPFFWRNGQARDSFFLSSVHTLV